MGEVEQMFLGQYQHSLDSKGRLTVPSRYREMLISEGSYITQGFDHNLMLLTEPMFMRISERLNRMNMTAQSARLLRRLIFSSAERVEVDKAGRILIPEFLRIAAGLDGEAVVVGAGDFIEIWEPTLWVEQQAQLQDADANNQRFAVLDLST
jgi:MraZ protein